VKPPDAGAVDQLLGCWVVGLLGCWVVGLLAGESRLCHLQDRWSAAPLIDLTSIALAIGGQSRIKQFRRGVPIKRLRHFSSPIGREQSSERL
jgi:hypothetical protein